MVAVPWAWVGIVAACGALGAGPWALAWGGAVAACGTLGDGGVGVRFTSGGGGTAVSAAAIARATCSAAAGVGSGIPPAMAITSKRVAFMVDLTNLDRAHAYRKTVQGASPTQRYHPD